MEHSTANLDFLTALKGAQLVIPSCPIPPPSQIQPEIQPLHAKIFVCEL